MDIGQAIEMGSFLDELKQKLDDEMEVDEVKEMRRLMKDKLGYMYDSMETEQASDLVTFLENNTIRSKVVSILKHVMEVMKFHGTTVSSFYEWIDTYQTTYGYLEDENFVGRQKDIEAICDMLITGPSLGVWIYGFGGVGKTTLAREIGTRMARKRGIQFKYVDLKQMDTPSDMFRTILRKFDCSSHETDIGALQRRTLTLFLEEIDTETWLLLDNIQTMYDNHKGVIKPFLRSWTTLKPHKVKLLVTSRNELDANCLLCIHQYPLKALDDEASLRFLKTYCKPADLDSDQYRRIMECCGNIPLAMLLVSNTISHQGWEHLYLDSIIKGQGQINECIEYAFEKLDDHMKACLVQLAVFDVTRFSASAVCEVLDARHEEAIVILMQLCHRDMLQKKEYLTEEDADEQANMNSSPTSRHLYKYFFHELVLQFLREKQEAVLSADSLHACHLRFAMWVFSVLKKSYDEYFKNNLKCIEFIHANAHLFRTLFKILDPGIREYLSVTECAEMQMASAVVLSSHVEKSKHITSIKSKYANTKCSLYWEIEDAALAIDNDCLKDAGTMLSKTENDPVLFNNRDRSIIMTKVHLLYHKGRLLRKQGDLTSAEQALRTALNLLEIEKSGEIYCVSKSALILNALGNVAHDRGKQTHDPKHFDASLDFHKRAADTLQAVVGNQAHREMSLYKFNIGTIAFAKSQQFLRGSTEGDKQARLDNLNKCLTWFDKSIEDDMKLCLQDSCDFADKLHIRSKVRLELEDFDDALNDVKESNAIRHRIMKEIKHPKKLLSSYFIGRIYLKQREQKTTSPKERTELLKKAKICFDEVCGFIQAGDLTIRNEGVAAFLYDYGMLARATGSKVYITQVDKLCLRVQAGRKATSSTDTTSSSSEDEPDSPHDISHEGSERKDSGVQMDISSAEVGEPTTADGHREEDVFLASFQRMSSDGVFMSDDEDDVNTSGLSPQTAKQKRKRESDSE